MKPILCAAVVLLCCWCAAQDCTCPCKIRGPSATRIQRGLSTSDVSGPKMILLQSRTGWNLEQVKTKYRASGANNFGQFVVAVLAARELSVDVDALLRSMKTLYLRDALVSLGVDEPRANQQIRVAVRELVAENSRIRPGV